MKVFIFKKCPKLSCMCNRDVPFLLVMRDKPILAYFLTVHTYKLLLGKIMQTQPCRKYLLENNGYNILAGHQSETTYS
jgi:hypothetical protein